jgi:hypothetical protein
VDEVVGRMLPFAWSSNAIRARPRSRPARASAGGRWRACGAPCTASARRWPAAGRAPAARAGRARGGRFRPCWWRPSPAACVRAARPARPPRRRRSPPPASPTGRW